MACNCLCCGCTNCAEGDQGPCCCGGSSGTCCAAGETCCAGVCCPPGEICVDGVCEPPTGACCVDGECSETTEENCAGVWQGAGTTCEDGDCNELCCVPEGGDCVGATYWNCRAGYFAGYCESLGGSPSEDCDTTKTHGLSGNPLCEDGGPASVTVTVAGATATSADFQSVADAVNVSFVIDLPCGLSVTELVDQVSVTVNGVTSTWYIFIQVVINTTNGIVSATVTVNSSNPPASPPNGFGSSANNQDTVLSSSYTNCHGQTVYDCTTYALSAGLYAWSNASGVIDFTNATIAVS